MFSVQVKEHFDAGHYLRGYEGKCAHTHGHRFEYSVVVEGSNLDELGMLIDFVDIKRRVDDNYDHKLLNEVPPFDKINPTAENLSKVIYQDLNKAFAERARVLRVQVWESPNCSAAYYE